MAIVGNGIVTFKTKCDAEIVLWTTLADVTMVGSGSGTLQDVKTDDGALFTAIEWCKQPPTKSNPEESMTLVPAGAVVVTFSSPFPAEAHATHVSTLLICKGLEITFTGAAFVEAATEAIVAEQKAKCKAAVRAQSSFIAKNKLKFHNQTAHAICAPVMVEADLPFNGTFMSTPAVAGWPQCDRLRYDCNTYFIRALTYACLVSGCQVDRLSTNPSAISAKILDLLAATTLTAFAGNYPPTAETTDDRSMGEIKLGLNRDCDDMAITVVAAFNHLRRVGAINYTANNTCTQAIAQLATVLHNYIVTTYTCAATVICQAVAHVAVPGVPGSKDSPLCGHVFAVLCRNIPHERTFDCKTLMQNCLVVESTRMSSPYSDPLSVFVHGNQPVFTGRPEYHAADAGIRGVKPFNAAQYPICVSAYTKDASYLLVDAKGTIGCPIDSLQAGKCCAMVIPQTDECTYTSSLNSLCHTCDYDVISNAAVANSWQTHLSVPVNAFPMSTDRLGAWQLTGDAAQLKCMTVQPSPSVMKLSDFTAYAFVSLDKDHVPLNCML